jgi:hypothetical protein
VKHNYASNVSPFFSGSTDPLEVAAESDAVPRPDACVATSHIDHTLNLNKQFRGILPARLESGILQRGRDVERHEYFSRPVDRLHLARVPGMEGLSRPVSALRTLSPCAAREKVQKWVPGVF